MTKLREAFLHAHEDALNRWNAGERDVVFPAGTVGYRPHAAAAQGEDRADPAVASGWVGRRSQPEPAEGEPWLVLRCWFAAGPKRGTLAVRVR